MIRITMVVSLLAVLILSLVSCGLKPLKTYTPSAEFEKVDETEQLPIGVTLIIKPEFENYIYEKEVVSSNGKSTNLSLDIGASSRDLFEAGLADLFQRVDVHTAQNATHHNQLVFIPSIIWVDAQAGKWLRGTTLDTPNVTITYGLTITNTHGDELIQTTSTGESTYKSLGFTVSKDLIALVTLGTTAQTGLNLVYARAFGEAEGKAYDALMDELKRSSAFATSVAIAMEAERQGGR